MHTVTNFRAEVGHNVDANDYILSKNIAETLNKHYPGHLWAVHINSELTGGYVTIKNFRISFKYGMFIKLKTIYADPSLKTVIRMAGELLERAKMRRGKANGEYARVLEGAAEKHQPRNGNII